MKISIWELQKAERQMSRDFTDLVRKYFGEDALGCLHLHYNTPQVAIELQDGKWSNFSIEQNGCIECVDGEKHPKQTVMLAVIEEFFYKGENNGNDDN